MSPWLALALAIIVAGGLAILLRLRLLGIAIGFWVTFAASIAVLAASGHAMTARWHLGPVSDWYFWQVLAFSPEILVFLFFMITDPKTIPAGSIGRRRVRRRDRAARGAPAAPQTTEFATKVALLSSLSIVCAARPLLSSSSTSPAPRGQSGRLQCSRRAAGGAGRGGARRRGRRSRACSSLAGIPARSSAGRRDSPPTCRRATSPRSRSAARRACAPIDRAHGAGDRARRRRRSPVEADALRRRDRDARSGGSGRRPARRRCGSRSGLRRAAPIVVPHYLVERMRVTLEPGEGQAPPTVVADDRRDGRARDVLRLAARRSSVAALRRASSRDVRAHAGGRPLPDRRPRGGRRPRRRRSPPLRVRSRGVRRRSPAGRRRARSGSTSAQGAFRFGVERRPEAMMGGGLCWIDYDNDGWLDLFVVNSYADDEHARWQRAAVSRAARSSTTCTAEFVDVSRGSGADLQLRGQRLRRRRLQPRRQHRSLRDDRGYTSPRRDAALEQRRRHLHGGRARGRDRLLRLALRRRGRRTSTATAARISSSPATPTPNAPIPGSTAGFPTNHVGRARPPLPQRGHRRERPLALPRGRAARRPRGEAPRPRSRRGLHGRQRRRPARPLCRQRRGPEPAVPQRPGPGRGRAGLGFRFVERARQEGVADPNAGMGIAAADYSGDGRDDLFVSNSRGQTHAVFRSAARRRARPFADARPDFAAALRQELHRLGRLLGRPQSRRHPRPRAGQRRHPGHEPRSRTPRRSRCSRISRRRVAGRVRGRQRPAGAAAGPRVNGRGLAAADFDNDGNIDIAINTIGGPLVLLRNTTAPRPLARGHSSTGFAPGAVVTAVLPGRPQARPRGSRRQQLPLLGGSPRSLRPRRRDESR